MKILDTRIQDALPEGRDFMIRELGFSGRSHRPLRMDGGAIALCLEGEADISIDGVVHKVSKHCQAVLLDGSTLFIKRCDQDFRVQLFIYSKEMAYQAMHKFDPSFFTYMIAEPVHRHASDILSSAGSYMQILSDLQIDAHNRFSLLIATNLLRCMMFDLYDKLKRKGDLSADLSHTRKEDIYSNFISLVTENVRKCRDVAFYAGRLCISSRYLCGVTRAVAGETPKQTIDGFLVSEIKLMLTFSDMSIQQIADCLNFPDQSYLGRFFKRYVGMSPQAYRKNEMVL